MDDGVKRLLGQKQSKNTNHSSLTTKTKSLFSSNTTVGSLQTFFEYPEKVISSPCHSQPPAIDLLTTTKNPNLSASYYHQQASGYLFGGGGGGGLGFGDFYNDGGGDSSSYLPTYDSIFGQFKDDDEDGKDRKSNSWLHLKTILTMFFAKRECTIFL